ncbi:MAG: DUF2344 domain-containing protein [Clostridia bacterium]|nr:DUF2344 domain-containing protein [Clostridia bacterium]
MLSEFKKISEYPTLETPVTIRLGFYKKGALQYISHLDLQRTFQRILSRAELPLWYTQGFNPHPKLVFGLPLPIGCESVCEMADIKLVRDMPEEDILARLHKATVDDLDFFACYPAERKFADIDGALYEYNIDCDVDDEMLEKIDRVLSNSPLTVLKHTKSGDKEVDIFPLIKSFELEKCEGGLKITALLAAGSNQNLSPEYLLEALRKRLIFLREEENYSIKRLSIHDAKGKIFK